MDSLAAALEEAEAERRLVLDTANDAYVAADDDSVIIDWNRRAEELFGWGRGEIVGQRLTETIIPPRFRAAHREGMERFVATGEQRMLFRRLELPARRRDGREIDVELTIWPTRTVQGWRFNAFLHDVTGRKRMAARVELLGRVTEAANAANDVESSVRTALEAVCSLTGWPVGHAFLADREAPERMVATGWWHGADGGEATALRQATEASAFVRGRGLPGRVAATGQPAWIRDIGEDRNFPRWRGAEASGFRSAFAFPLRVRDEVVGVLEFFAREPTDPDPDLLEVMADVGTQLGRVVERVRAADSLARANADLRAADEMKNRFLSIASHELRTPLATIAGFASMLEEAFEDFPPEERREYLRSIRRQTQRLNRLVDDLLTVSRIEAGAIVARPASVDVCAAIAQALADMGAAGVEVVCPPGTQVAADRDHLQQVLVNLLTNAERHGGPPVTVVAERNGEHVDIRVVDRGPGVPEGLRPHLFQRFSRPARRVGSGTGLGLSIVDGLVRANGGEVTYRPVEPHGSSFTVRLPLP